MNRIDFHHHIVPDVYREALAKAGRNNVGGVPFPAWKPEDVYMRMEQLGISTKDLAAMLGVSTQRVRQLAARIGGKKVGKQWLFPEGRLDRARSERRKN